MFEYYHDKYPPFDMKTSSAKRIAAEKAAVFALINKEENMKKSENIKKNRKLPAVLVACAAAAIGMTVTVGAVCEWDYGKLVSGFFPRAVTEGPGAAGTSAVVPELVENAAAKLDGLMRKIPLENVTNTYKNYDVSFDGFICDGKALMISASFRKKDGSPFTAEEIESYDVFWSIHTSDNSINHCKECLILNDDGSMQALGHFIVKELNENAAINVELSGLIKDYEGLKSPQQLSGLSSDTLLDDGTLSAEFVPDINCKSRDLVLMNADGETVEVRVTPISAEYIFEPWQFTESTMYLLMQGNFYDKNGGLVYSGSTDSAYGTGDETGYTKGYGFTLLIFNKPIDPTAIETAECSGYAYGREPEKPNVPEKVEKSLYSGLESLMQPVTGEYSGELESYNVSFNGTIYTGKTLILSSTVSRKDGRAMTINDAGRFILYPDIESDIDIGPMGCYHETMSDGSEKFTTILEANSDLSDNISVILGLRYEPDKSIVSAKVNVKRDDRHREFVLTSPDNKKLTVLVTPISAEVYFDEYDPYEVMDYLDIEILGENGKVLASRGNNSGDNLCDPDGGLYIKVFSNAIDIDSVTDIKIKGYSLEK